MEVRKFKKKPLVVEAIQFTGFNSELCEEFIGDDRAIMYTEHFTKAKRLIIPTLEGDMNASIGDWIIKGVTGEFYPCKPDVFAATYDEEEEKNG